jgi:hypothetical protein
MGFSSRTKVYPASMIRRIQMGHRNPPTAWRRRHTGKVYSSVQETPLPGRRCRGAAAAGGSREQGVCMGGKSPRDKNEKIAASATSNKPAGKAADCQDSNTWSKLQGMLRIGLPRPVTAQRRRSDRGKPNAGRPELGFSPQWMLQQGPSSQHDEPPLRVAATPRFRPSCPSWPECWLPSCPPPSSRSLRAWAFSGWV